MTEQEYMRRAIELAWKGAGWTSPNPLVGAVVVKDGRIIGEGYHAKYGEFHAERNALNACSEDPAGATLYVTLEPCCHTGKTPPCTDIIIEKKIARVVIGSRDPNPKVAGRGAAILREAGIDVVEDFLREECDELNPVFFQYITTGIPYVVMKYAMTLDGKIATWTGASRWVTEEEARRQVHRMRGRYAAIMAGIGTVLADDPMLNCRLEGAHQPVRVILDSRLRIPMDCKICQTAREYRTIIVCCEDLADESRIRKLEVLGATVWKLPKKGKGVDLAELMRRLGREKIDSVLIEGGGTINESALKQGIVNHVCAYIAPKIFGGKDAKTPVEGHGIEWPDQAAVLHNRKISTIGDDVLLEYDVKGGR